jgi:hypothetical protein
MSYTPPSADEIARVDEYRQRVKAITCDHPSLGQWWNDPTCLDCGHSMRFLSDIQIEDLRGRRPTDEVLDGLLAQMGRGGVKFEVDGQWREVRFTAHPLPGFDGSGRTEYACIPVDEVALLLRATDAR